MDREIDMVSPLVYSFYYFPLVMDVLPMHYDHQSCKVTHKREEKEEEMNLDERILSNHKNMHIYRAFEAIHTDLQEFKQNSKAAQFQTGKKEDVRAVMKELPDYQKTTKSYHEHLGFMDQIGQLKTQLKLDDLC